MLLFIRAEFADLRALKVCFLQGPKDPDDIVYETKDPDFSTHLILVSCVWITATVRKFNLLATCLLASLGNTKIERTDRNSADL